MCIIILKPINEKIPDKKILEQCFKENSDGIGYMYRKNNKIHIVKGFFNLNDFYKSIKKVENNEICIHFRYSTHGEISEGNCHPFPLTKSIVELQQKKISCNIGICHNGIISEVEKHETLSDTMMFIKNLNIDSIKEISNKVKISDGKFCVMTKYKTYLIGHFIYDKGYYFSNLGYLPDEIEEEENIRKINDIRDLSLCEFCLYDFIESKEDNCKMCVNFSKYKDIDDYDNEYEEYILSLEKEEL